ncbi:MAG TPA: hypothetical protein VIZ18_05370 [Ktedonobacteraceae bacterium]
MLIRVFSATQTAKVLITISLLLLLVGCGNDVNLIKKATPSQQVTLSTIPQSRPVHSIDFDIAHIHVHSGEGIVCLNYPTINTVNPFVLHANLVLTQNRLSYDPTEIQQMRAYAASVYGIPFPKSPPLGPPSTLNWIQGTIVGDVDGRSFASNLLGTGCFGEMELTYTGENSVLIQSIKMQLTAMPVKTDPSYKYRMIDICSLLIGTEAGGACPPMAGGSSSVFDFIRLRSVPSGSVFIADQQINDPEFQSGSDIILKANSQFALPVIFYFTSLNNLVYALEPLLVLQTSNGTQQTVPLPQLATTLYFANLNQFPCYTLKGNTFVELTKYVSTDDPNGPYCV